MQRYTRALGSLLLGLLSAGSLPAAQAARAGGSPLIRSARLLVRVAGTVIDEQSQPVPGANVIEKQTHNGMAADASGKFALEVATGATLVVSAIGFVTQELVVGEQATLTVKLKGDVNELTEVVAVGYQTLRRSDLTGAVADVKARELNTTAPTLGQALVGKLAGVQAGWRASLAGERRALREH